MFLKCLECTKSFNKLKISLHILITGINLKAIITLLLYIFFSPDPAKPKCNETIVFRRTDRSLILDLANVKTDSEIKSYRVLVTTSTSGGVKIPYNREKDPLSNPFVRNLTAGTQYFISVSAVGQNDKDSLETQCTSVYTGMQ